MAPSGLGFQTWNLLVEGGSGVAVFPRTPEAARHFSAVSREQAEERLRRFGALDWRLDSPQLQITLDGTREDAGDRDRWPATMAWTADVLDEMSALFAEQTVAE